MPDTLWNVKVSGAAGRSVDLHRLWYCRAQELLDKVRSGRTKRALELGCGAGEFAYRLVERGWEVTACDGDRVTLAALRKANPPFDVVCCNFEQALPFPSASFDLVTLLEVIEHIAHAEMLVTQVGRILREDGFLIISTPNFSWFFDRVRYLLGAFPRNEGVHVRFFTRSTLEQLLEGAGFSVSARRSFTRAVGWNRLRRLVGVKDPVASWDVPSWVESLLAQDFVWLARKEPQGNATWRDEYRPASKKEG